MSLSVDGFWKAGFWSQTFWADGFWYEGSPVEPPAETPQGGGGGTYGYARYRTDKEVRQERIARGIIPPDEPEAPILIEASKQVSPTFARMKLRQLAEGHARQAELDRLLAEIIQAQQIADEFAYQDMLRNLSRARRELTNMNNQTAIIVMLGLL